MRVMVLTTWYPSPTDPVKAVFVQRHAESLALGHDVLVAKVSPADSPPPPHEDGSLHVRHVPSAPKHPVELLRAGPALRRLVREFQPDVIHTMGFSSLLPGAVAGLRVPWVHTEHWSGTARPESVGPVWRASASLRHLLRLPDAVTVVSSDMARHLARFVRRGALHVVPNVVLGPDAPTERQPTASLQLFGLGALVPVKDPVMAVETVAWLRDQGHDVSLRWAGAGPLRDTTEAAVARRGLQDRVVLLGQVDPDQLAEHFAWCTEFFLPTRHETFCVAAAEALAHGRPVVLGATGGQRDFIDADVGALVADPSPEAFGRALLDVRGRLGAVPAGEFAARTTQRFSPHAVAQQFDRVYEQVLGR